MEYCVRCGILLIALGAAVSAQTLIEHANVTGTAAVGATAGAAIGTKLNQALGVLGEAAKTGEPKATEAKKAKPAGIPSPAAVAAKDSGQSNVVPNPGFFQASSGDSRPALGAAPALAPMAPGAVPTVQQQVTIPPVQSALQPTRTKEQILTELANIKPGLARETVIEKLGSPAYRISYDYDGRLMERLRFRVGIEDIAVVELKDGVVDTARPLVR